MKISFSFVQQVAVRSGYEFYFIGGVDSDPIAGYFWTDGRSMEVDLEKGPSRLYPPPGDSDPWNEFTEEMCLELASHPVFKAATV